MAGMDAMRFLESEDTVERIVMVAVANHWYKERDQLDQNLAIRIINQLGKGMKS